MAGCDMFVIENGVVTDLYSDSNSWPLEDSEQDCSIVAKSEGTNGKIYYTVNKLNPSKDSLDRTIIDMTYQLQYAWGTSAYGDHHRNYGKKSVNFFKQADLVNTTDYQGGSTGNGGSTDNGGSQNNTDVGGNDEDAYDDLDDRQDEGSNYEDDVGYDVTEDNSDNNSDDNLEDDNLEDDQIEDDKSEDNILEEEKDGSSEQLYQTMDNSNIDSASLLLVSYVVALLI